jgi:hypothetical protein
VRELVVAWLGWHDEIDKHERTAELTDRVDGYRIVGGGQADPDGSWELTDVETGERLTRGIGLESFNAAWQGSWTHIDAIGRDAHQVALEPDGDFGLPRGLAHALREWVVDQPDEARQVISASSEFRPDSKSTTLPPPLSGSHALSPRCECRRAAERMNTTNQ